MTYCYSTGQGVLVQDRLLQSKTNFRSVGQGFALLYRLVQNIIGCCITGYYVSGQVIIEQDRLMQYRTYLQCRIVCDISGQVLKYLTDCYSVGQVVTVYGKLYKLGQVVTFHNTLLTYRTVCYSRQPVFTVQNGITVQDRVLQYRTWYYS